MEALRINTEPFKQHTEHLQRRSSPNADGVILAGPITLVDHTLSPDGNSFGCWARGAEVVDYVIVSGTPARGGAYVSWICAIETLEGVKFHVQKRYSEFFALREKLVVTFPRSQKYLPPLPPKSVISKFRKRFLDSRQQGLSYFLSSIILNPEFAGSPLVREFLFSDGVTSKF
ncbi:PX-domain-containing protein [Ascobolus immersus RN42]|uniref:Endosomal/vacuolar adapter protein YPT35 n=1 Tax=Ascobolus immersus RN42 TaxID=1160509 RepID=A0A3N4IR52_ASCIM|nr:PX-domain-containing protein [Ascobolus immersus RN42]